MINIILAFTFAALISNFTEWFMHKYILHGLGKDKNSFFNHHWRHHNICRKNNNKDLNYIDWFHKKNDVWKEIISLAFLTLFNIIWLWIWPAFFYSLVFWTVVYFVIHAKSHKDPEWCDKWMPHHKDHHMGKNQNLNWCVTYPLFDYVFGTRKKYIYDENDKCIGEK